MPVVPSPTPRAALRAGRIRAARRTAARRLSLAAALLALPAGAAQAATQVTALSTTFGPSSGGTAVTITGSGFTGATGVSFDTSPAVDVLVESDTEITATAPPHAAAAVDVTVQGPDSTSPATCADTFAYV